MTSSLRRNALRLVATAALAGVIAATGGCSGEYGYTRSVFQGKVVDRPAAEIESFAGKPDNIERLSGGDEIWTYNRRTFDSENANAKDAAVKITLRKDPKTGALAYADIEFVSQ